MKTAPEGGSEAEKTPAAFACTAGVQVGQAARLAKVSACTARTGGRIDE